MPASTLCPVCSSCKVLMVEVINDYVAYECEECGEQFDNVYDEMEEDWYRVQGW